MNYKGHEEHRELQRWSGTRMAILLVLCIVSRLVSTIYYIEDTDSLRFALAVLDYDIVQLQPHFPGYPVFCFLATLLYALTGSFAVSFSIIGGCAVFVICIVAVKLGEAVGICSNPLVQNQREDDPGKRKSLAGSVLLFLIFFNPLLWLMSNRYMPDLCGAACALAALYFLVVSGRFMWLGFALGGLLGGIRLSYMPMLLLPIGMAAVQSAQRGTIKRDTTALVAAVAVWLLPLIAVTGLSELVQAATAQTSGHFTDFGGTIITEGTVVDRLLHAIGTLLVDGLGLYAPGRHWATAITTAGVVCALVVGCTRIRRDHRVVLLVLSWVVYFLWIVLFQNVLHKNRHVLPLIPFLLLLAAGGYAVVMRNRTAMAVAGATLISYSAVALVLVAQHRQPTAIAQIKEYLQQYEGDSLTVVAAPLVNYYLSGQRIRAVYIAADDPGAAARIRARSGSRIVSVGNYRRLIGRQAGRTRTFYHNPFVNRMWSEITVYEF